MEEKMKTYIMIMFVYMLITYILGPVLYYTFVDKTLVGAGKGFLIGSVLSIILWLVYGSKLVIQ